MVVNGCARWLLKKSDTRHACGMTITEKTARPVGQAEHISRDWLMHMNKKLPTTRTGETGAKPVRGGTLGKLRISRRVRNALSRPSASRKCATPRSRITTRRDINLESRVHAAGPKISGRNLWRETPVISSTSATRFGGQRFQRETALRVIPFLSPREIRSALSLSASAQTPPTASCASSR